MMWLIDGYNFCHALGYIKQNLGPTGLESARLRLLGLLAGALKEQASEAMVVFDAPDRQLGHERTQSHRGVQILYSSPGRQADDEIEDLIRQHSAPRKLTVVSNDRRLIRAGARRRCRTAGCEEFMDWLESQYSKDPPPPTESSAKPQPGTTEEWMEEFADLENDPSLKNNFGY